jgi:hypothetical protein
LLATVARIANADRAAATVRVKQIKMINLQQRHFRQRKLCVRERHAGAVEVVVFSLGQYIRAEERQLFGELILKNASSRLFSACPYVRKDRIVL